MKLTGGVVKEWKGPIVNAASFKAREREWRRPGLVGETISPRDKDAKGKEAQVKKESVGRRKHPSSRRDQHSNDGSSQYLSVGQA